MSLHQLLGHVSPETAHVVADYPYGFRLRCQIRYWIETKPGHGQRFVSQTSNPKVAGLVWNKPKAGIYHPIVVMYVNQENGHVEHTSLSPYEDLEVVEAFARGWQLDVAQDRTIRFFRVARRVANGMSREEAIAKAGVAS